MYCVAEPYATLPRPDGFPEGRIFMLQTRGAPEVFGIVTTQQSTHRPPPLQQYRVHPPYMRIRSRFEGPS